VLSAEAQIPTRLLRTGHVGDEDWQTLYKIAAEIADLPIYICDEPELNTTQLRAHLAKARVKYKIDLFAVDYLYLMTDGEGVSPTERTEILSKRVKAIQRSMGIAGITINSVTKDGMDGKRPKQTSMRGSGQLIHDADVVLFITKHSIDEKLRVIEITKGRDLAEQGKIELLKTDSYPTFKDVTHQSSLEEMP
jgi:replicative DNA helicase